MDDDIEPSQSGQPSRSAIPAHLMSYLEFHRVDAEILIPGVPMPTVPLAAAAIGVAEARILKSLIFATADRRLVLAIVAGPARVDRTRLAAAAGLPHLRLADPATVLAATGYPAGGVAPIAHITPIPVIIDVGAASLDVAYGGAGIEEALIRIAPTDIIQLTNAIVADITRDDLPTPVAAAPPHTP